MDAAMIRCGRNSAHRYPPTTRPEDGEVGGIREGHSWCLLLGGLDADVEASRSTVPVGAGAMPFPSYET